MENTFIGLPTKFEKSDPVCVKKIEEAEEMGINPKNYCPECFEDKARFTGTYFIKVADIEDFSFGEEGLQIKRYQDPPEIFLIFDIKEEEFFKIMSDAGVKVFFNENNRQN